MRRNNNQAGQRRCFPGSRRVPAAVFLLICILLLTFQSCVFAESKPDHGQLMVFGVQDIEAEHRSIVVGRELNTGQDSGYEIDLVIKALLESSDSDSVRCPFPEGTKALGWKLIGTELTLDLSTEYGSLSGTELSTADCCAVLTLCSIGRVETVRLTVEGEPHPNREDRPFSAQDFVIELGENW